MEARLIESQAPHAGVIPASAGRHSVNTRRPILPSPLAGKGAERGPEYRARRNDKTCMRWH